MPPPSADFRSIKQRIPIDHVLARYGVKLRPGGPHTLCGPCPLPTHTSRQSHESFSVNLARQVWSCHSASCIAARHGRLGGHVIDLVAIMEGCSLRQAGIRLQDWFGWSVLPSLGAPLPPVAVESSDAQPNRPLDFALQGIDTRHRYLTRRGISPYRTRVRQWTPKQGLGRDPRAAPRSPPGSRVSARNSPRIAQVGATASVRLVECSSRREAAA